MVYGDVLVWYMVMYWHVWVCMGMPCTHTLIICVSIYSFFFVHHVHTHTHTQTRTRTLQAPAYSILVYTPPYLYVHLPVCTPTHLFAHTSTHLPAHTPPCTYTYPPVYTSQCIPPIPTRSRVTFSSMPVSLKHFVWHWLKQQQQDY